MKISTYQQLQPRSFEEVQEEDEVEQRAAKRR